MEQSMAGTQAGDAAHDATEPQMIDRDSLPSEGWVDAHSLSPEPARVLRMEGPFAVAGRTLERGWLVIDPTGEPYGLDNAQFAVSFALEQAS